MRPLTAAIPKALIDVAGKPFIERQLILLKSQGIKRVVMCVGYLGEKIEAVVGEGGRWGLEVNYSYDGVKLLGTGGALRRALPLLGERFLVLYGDSYLSCDYSEVERVFLQSQKLALMTVFRNNNQWDQSNVSFLKGQITCYDKQQPTLDMQYIDYGLGVFQAKVFNSYPEDTVLDLATIYKDLIIEGQLAGLEVHERFYEIGSLSGLQETRNYFQQRHNL